MQNQIRFQAQVAEVLNDTEDFKHRYGSQILQLKSNYPGNDDYWYDYWASRLSFIGHAEDVTITFDSDEDPSEITITIKPDYGS